MFKKILFIAAILFAVIPTLARADVAPLTITKQVRNVTQGGVLAGSVNAVVGDELEFEVVVQNTSQAVVPTVTISDVALSSLQFGKNIYVSRPYAGTFGTPGIQVGSLERGDIAVLRYRAVLTAPITSTTLCSVSNAASGAVSVTAIACVYVQNAASINSVNGSGIVRQSVSVSNDTKNTTGSSVAVQKEDFLTYTFTATNAGTVSVGNYAIAVNISGVLPLVDVVDLGGGILNGSVVTYSAGDMLPGASMARTVRVRVKYYVPPYAFRLSVTYGNEVVVIIPHTTPLATAYVAPNAGTARSVSSFAFVSLILAGAAFVLSQKRLRTALFR